MCSNNNNDCRCLLSLSLFLPLPPSYTLCACVCMCVHACNLSLFCVPLQFFVNYFSSLSIIIIIFALIIHTRYTHTHIHTFIHMNVCKCMAGKFALDVMHFGRPFAPPPLLFRCLLANIWHTLYFSISIVFCYSFVFRCFFSVVSCVVFYAAKQLSSHAFWGARVVQKYLW